MPFLSQHAALLAQLDEVSGPGRSGREVHFCARSKGEGTKVERESKLDRPPAAEAPR